VNKKLRAIVSRALFSLKKLRKKRGGIVISHTVKGGEGITDVATLLAKDHSWVKIFSYLVSTRRGMNLGITL